MIVQLSATDVTDLAEMMSYLEGIQMPTGHTAFVEVIDGQGYHYATMKVNDSSEVTLQLTAMPSSIQDT